MPRAPSLGALGIGPVAKRPLAGVVCIASSGSRRTQSDKLWQASFGGPGCSQALMPTRQSACTGVDRVSWLMTVPTQGRWDDDRCGTRIWVF